jgi:hypothetical protein
MKVRLRLLYECHGVGSERATVRTQQPLIEDSLDLERCQTTCPRTMQSDRQRAMPAVQLYRQGTGEFFQSDWDWVDAGCTDAAYGPVERLE